jgi:hypothetical protein
MAMNSKEFTRATVTSVSKAKGSAKELLAAATQSGQAAQNLVTYLTKVEAVCKTRPTDDFGTLEQDIPKLKAVRMVCESELEQIDLNAKKLSQSYATAFKDIEFAKKTVHDFDVHCADKAKKWDATKKKAHGNDVKVITKAKADIAAIEKDLKELEAAARSAGLMG